MNTRRDFLGLLGAVLAGSGCAGPAARSWSVSRLGAADAIARRHGGRGWAAWQGGSRIFTWQSGHQGPVLSIAKSLAALAATRAAAEGWLDDSEQVATTLGEWRGDPRKSRITVAMLLQQTAGLEAGVAALYRNPADKGRKALAVRAVDVPGRFFRYGPACWEVLAELLQRKLAGRGDSLEGFLDRAVMRPVGLASPAWRADQAGRRFLSTGPELSVDELGRLGRTIGALLRGENAAGFEAGHFATMTRPSAANPLFGGGLWRNVHAGRQAAREIEIEDALDPPPPVSFWRDACLSRSQPAELVALIGSSGRRVFIWPSQDRVVARLGVASSWQDRPFLQALPG